METRPSLREQKKTETRVTLLREARRLFQCKGFEAATIDEICMSARVSRRTFFRYFASKEALVFPNRELRLERFRQLLADRRAEDDVFSTLRAVTVMMAVEYTENRDQLLALQELINSSTGLLAREREIDREWEGVLEEAFTVEAGSTPGARRRARVLAGASIGVIRATLRHWFETDGSEDLSKLGLDAIDALQRGFPLDVVGAGESTIAIC